MKPNRFALRPKLGRVRSVILEPDVAEVFHSSDDVNAFLRSAIKPGQAQRPCPHAERRRKLRRSAQAERGTGDGSDGRGKQRSDRGLARRLWRTGGWGRMGSGLRMGGWGRVFGPTLERSEKTVHDGGGWGRVFGPTLERWGRMGSGLLGEDGVGSSVRRWKDLKRRFTASACRQVFRFRVSPQLVRARFEAAAHPLQRA